MKQSSQLVAALLFAGASVVAPTATYRVNVVATDNVPPAAIDAILADPEASFQAIFAATPETSIVDPSGSRRGLLRGGAAGEDEPSRNRVLPIKICSTSCAYSVYVTESTNSTNSTGGVRQRELFEEAADPQELAAVADLETVFSRSLTETMCGEARGELHDCGVEVKLTRL
jgi:hypothetical protein